jgi:hypothetical protein
MIRVHCKIALTHGDAAQLERVKQALDARLPGYFADGSRGAGGPDIELVPDVSDFDNECVRIDPKKATNSFALNSALGRLVGANPAPPKGPEVTVGLLLADEFETGGIFGLMFDQRGGGLPSFEKVQREGAALFLKTIGATRKKEDEFLEQVVFSAAHELGHVFNLPHKDTPLNFMTESDKERPVYPTTAFHFEADHRAFLHQCSTSKFVRPGGSKWQDRNALLAGPTDRSPADGASSRGSALTLRVDVRPRQVWYFEPIELDVVLSLARSAERAERVPNALDPGYDRFQIWVTKPNGERVLQRSTSLFCRSGERLRLAPGQRFSRDVTLSVSGLNPIFQSAGDYLVQVVFRPDARRRIVSNQTRFSILPTPQRDPFYGVARHALARADVAALMLDRNTRPAPAVRALQALVDENGPGRVIDAGRYALGRALVSSPRRDAQRVYRGVELLRAAADSETLGKHRRGKARALVRLHR